VGYDLKHETDGTFLGTSKAWTPTRMGYDTMRSVTLDLSAFTLATHYPDGYLRSGLVIALNTSTSLWVPYVNAGANGTGIPGGHLFDDVRVRSTNTTGRAVGALYWEGIVTVSRLPVNSGLHATDRPARIRYEA
jgi:hypothetical protein